MRTVTVLVSVTVRLTKTTDAPPPGRETSSPGSAALVAAAGTSGPCRGLVCTGAAIAARELAPGDAP